MSIRSVLGLAVAGLLAGCASSWTTIDLARLPTAASHPESTAVVLFDEKRVEFWPPRRGDVPIVDVSRHVRTRILREGDEKLAQIAVYYQEAFSRVTAFKARVIAPDGSQRIYKRADAADVPANQSFVLYSDNRALVLRIDSAPPGAVIEYEYTLRYTDSRLATFEQEFGGGQPTLHARFVVSVPRGWEIEHAAQRLNQGVAFEPTETKGPDRTQWIWERRDLAALPDEALGPGAPLVTTRVGARLRRWQSAERVAVAAPRDAQQLSAWVAQLIAQPPTSDGTKQLAEDILQKVDRAPLERARLLYNWVRDNISYCAIEIGVGGWRPHAATDVLRLRYGDCKDKANLLVRLLDAAGVRAHLVLVHSHSGLAPRLSLPVPRFNHAIVGIERAGAPMLFVDPTSRTTAFGRLPLQDQESEVLPVSNLGHPMGEAPGSTPEDNHSESEFVFALDGDRLRGSIATTRRGYFADAARAELLRAPREKHGETTVRLLGVRSKLAKLRFENAGAPVVDEPFVVRGEATLQLGSVSAGLFVFRFADLVAAPLASLPATPRQTPLVLRARRQSVDRVRITLPKGSDDVVLPKPCSLERPFGRYELRWRREGDVLVGERTFVLRERIFAAADYAALQEFLEQIAAAENAAVTAHKPKG